MASPIKHVFVVMMENRSFDHMLGHLHADNSAIDGIRADDPAWLASVANPHAGGPYPPFPLSDPHGNLQADPPHGRRSIETQLRKRPDGSFAMDGFVAAYAEEHPDKPIDDQANRPPPMGWFGAKQAPVSAFLARNFMVCNRWFAPLPAATQPNRLMAMSGVTVLDHNAVPMPKQKLVYEWLKGKARWRVYHDNLPFFMIMLERVPTILTSKKFRDFSGFARELATGGGDFPEVVFIEPTYGDSPFTKHHNDDHGPAGIARGQKFLWQVYKALEAAPAVARSSVLIITYDEHGGFFDHVPPPKVRTDPPPKHKWKPGATAFESLGGRVPAIIVSPFVSAGSVHSEVLDHTSVLKLLGTLFGGGSYSPQVDARPVGNVHDALDALDAPRALPPIPDFTAYFSPPATAFAAAHKPIKPTGRAPGTVPQTRMEEAFQAALDEIRKQPPAKRKQYEDLLAAFPPDPANAPVVTGGEEAAADAQPSSTS